MEKKLQLLNDIADVHNNHIQVVYGNLTTANVLLDAKHNTVLSDFGISFVVDEFAGTAYMTTMIAGGGSLRWGAPELFAGWEEPKFRPVKGYESDIYSFGGVLYHVLSGDVPFQGRTDLELITLVLQLRQRPERPSGDIDEPGIGPA
ncbi:kinase-like domain-containing protein [Mycena haematopus]|nr:kinase-like domain-containing protein [Mycena haematopus]